MRDEHSNECLAIKTARKLNSTDVIDTLTDLFILHGVPAYLRSDNGAAYVAQAVRDWFAAVGAKNSLHRAWLTLGEWILRAFQRTLP